MMYALNYLDFTYHEHRLHFLHRNSEFGNCQQRDLLDVLAVHNLETRA